MRKRKNYVLVIKAVQGAEGGVPYLVQIFSHCCVFYTFYVVLFSIQLFNILHVLRDAACDAINKAFCEYYHFDLRESLQNANTFISLLNNIINYYNINKCTNNICLKLKKTLNIPERYTNFVTMCSEINEQTVFSWGEIIETKTRFWLLSMCGIHVQSEHFTK